MSVALRPQIEMSLARRVGTFQCGSPLREMRSYGWILNPPMRWGKRTVSPRSLSLDIMSKVSVTLASACAQHRTVQPEEQSVDVEWAQHAHASQRRRQRSFCKI